MTDDFELTRRKALAALGGIGVASAGAGLGTSAYFSDQETFENNQLTAGTLDLKVSWAEHYSDWSEDEADFARMEDGELVVEDREGFMDATLQEQYPDDETRQAIESGEADPCEVLADVPDDIEKPVIGVSDVKPGDFGEVTFDFALCDNPGYVWLNGGLLDASENGLTEPEADDPDEGDGVELLDEIRVTVWYDSGNNVLEDPETIVTDREFEPNPISSAIAVSGEDRIVTQGTLREVLDRLSTEKGIPLDADPTTVGHDCYTNSPTVHYVGFKWELPVDHANEIQSDSVEFDLGFYTEQCRHNDGAGLAADVSTDLEAYYPLNGSAVDESGNGYDMSAAAGDASYTTGKVGQAASFDGSDDYLVADPSPTVSDSFTLSVWLNGAGFEHTSYPLAVSKWQAGQNRDYLIGYNGPQGRLYAQFNREPDGNKETLYGPVPATDTWYHCVLTYDAGSQEGTFYVDGTEVDQGTGPFDDTASSLVIGSKDGGGNAWNGLVDDVRIYARALSASEVQSLYESA
jgi:predicted ribosomally synthesized peptide with SipW-like signal peptide